MFQSIIIHKKYNFCEYEIWSNLLEKIATLSITASLKFESKNHVTMCDTYNCNNLFLVNRFSSAFFFEKL